MTEITESLIAFFAPWKSVYDHHTAVSVAVTFVHLAGLLFGGGLAVAADRATLRASRSPEESSRRRALDDMEAVHRPVLIAIAVSFLSGALLAAADLETFLGSRVFLIKLSLVALLLANGALLQRTERAARRQYAAGEVPGAAPWKRLRLFAWLSLVLWSAVALAGTTLVSAA